MPAAVDNTFASPYLCTPAAYGFDFVLHSATKYIGGHHDLIGGVVCTSEEGRARLRDTAIDTGGTMAPFEAWLCLRGLMTLALRMDRHCARTRCALGDVPRGAPEGRARLVPGARLAPAARRRGAAVPPRRRAACSRSRWRAASRAASAFCDALELAWVATSLGGTHTLVGHAASTTHRQMDARGAGAPRGSPTGSCA